MPHGLDLNQGFTSDSGHFFSIDAHRNGAFSFNARIQDQNRNTRLFKAGFKVKDLPAFGIHGGYKENIIHILISKSIFKKVGQYGLVYFHSKVLVIGVTF